MTEFMNAASQGKLNTIDKYLSDGGNPDAHDEVYTPCVAAKKIHFNGINFIPTYNVYISNFQFKRTALHRASMEGHTAVIQMLLENGTDINFKDRVRHAGALFVKMMMRLGEIHTELQPL